MQMPFLLLFNDSDLFCGGCVSLRGGCAQRFVCWIELVMGSFFSIMVDLHSIHLIYSRVAWSDIKNLFFVASWPPPVSASCHIKASNVAEIV